MQRETLKVQRSTGGGSILGHWLLSVGYWTLLLLPSLRADTHYVSLAGRHVAPYTNWIDAAQTVRAAAELAAPGDVIVVSNGVYDVDSMTVSNAANRVALTNAVTMKSLSGPSHTTLVGHGPLGDQAVRCAYVGPGAALIGFTLTNGFTRASGDEHAEQSGGGAWVAEGGVLSNCVIAGCEATKYGGGLYGMAVDCVLRGNHAQHGGGAGYSTLTRCRIESNTSDSHGGGVYHGVATDCVVVSNRTLSANGGGAASATLANCRIEGNYAHAHGGGAAACTISDSVIVGNEGGAGGGVNGGELDRCRLQANLARSEGGGAYSATLRNCLVYDNEAVTDGGGVYVSDGQGVRNSTVVGNRAGNKGGGLYRRYSNVGGLIVNSVVYHNTARVADANWCGGWQWSYSCTTPLVDGAGNIDDEPLLAGLSNGHIVAASPCVDTGLDVSAAGVADIDGQTRITGVAVDMGCDEIVIGATTGVLDVAVSAIATQVVAGAALTFDALIGGQPLRYEWRWGDELVTSNLWQASHAWGTPGEYAVVLWAANDSGAWSTTVGVEVVSSFTNYVSPSGSGLAPYTNWATAATNVQDAIDACLSGGTVLVGEGAYERGSYAVSGVNHRIGVWKQIRVVAVNAAEGATRIVGLGPVGDHAVRCAYVGPGALLTGFTLTNGFTRASGDEHAMQSGGGAWVAEGGVVSNCLIVGCEAAKYGGGVHGTSVDCVLRGNHAQHGGGAGYSTLTRCRINGNTSGDHGGGVYRGTATGCVIVGNRTGDTWSDNGGGASSATLTNCWIEGNYATGKGGGANASTLVNCRVKANTANEGGGTYGGTVDRSTIHGNAATDGAGVFTTYGGYVRNSLIHGNTASRDGGGVHFGDFQGYILNCTIAGNHAVGEGGGLYTRWGILGYVRNSIVYDNTSVLAGPNYGGSDGSQWSYSCTTPLVEGEGNLEVDPLLAGLGNGHIVAASPCVDAGNTDLAAGIADIDGEIRIAGASVDIGCDEVVVGTTTGVVSVAASSVATQVVAGAALSFDALIGGRPLRFEWRWGDGRVTSNLWQASHAWAVAGEYALVLWADNDSGSWSTTVGVDVVASFTNYVSPSGSGEPPYTNWTTAATNVQDAIDACLSGGTVLVGEGAYDRGSYEAIGGNHRIGLWKAITVRATNAAEGATQLVGLGPLGDQAIRCAYVGPGAALIGFTLTNGFTRASGDEHAEQSGGGAWVAEGGVLSNCVIAGCEATKYGGGLYGMAVDCVLRGNHAQHGGGAGYSTLTRCRIESNTSDSHGGGVYHGVATDCVVVSNRTLSANGGGAASATLANCRIEGNYAHAHGGGAAACTISDSVIVGNEGGAGGGVNGGELDRCRLQANLARSEGGGAYSATLRNCLVYDNEAVTDGGGVYVSDGQGVRNSTVVGNRAGNKGGGLYRRYSNVGGLIVNSVVYHNTAQVADANWCGGWQWSYSCTTPLVDGAGNIDDEPLFQDLFAGDYHLAPTSTCIDAGLNEDWMFASVDLDGRDRVLNQVVDMGAYETPFVIKIRALPQGAYSADTGALATNLTGFGMLPLLAPYAAARVWATQVPSDVVDWVLVELVDADSGTVSAARSGILRSDGWVVSHDGEEGVAAPTAEGRAYYLRIKHRNHLAVYSSLPVVFLANIASYDFTTGPDKVLGGTNACVELTPGVWGMIAGDCDGDGKITPVDRAIVSNQVGKTGYLPGDVNLDGVVTEEDVP